MYSEITVTRLNAIAHQYSDLIFQEVSEVLNQIKNTGSGVESLKVVVIDGTAIQSPQILLSFDDHLILLDKGKMQWTKLPNIDKLLQWARTKEPDEKKAVRLANKVAWDKKKNDTWKPKRWRRKSLSKVLKEMNERILKAYDEVIEDELTEAVRVL